jgi:X-Pro dipeptidyl-peptidase (S15 family)/X-Pro dipeptidyl-peptidase C-terminal non-catalytic domain
VPAAANAEPAPFGHACVPQAGVRVCRALSDAQRVPSWDGVPLAVDVTLPASGDGPFPTLLVLREPASVGADTLRYARRGYAVVDYSARGFGRSCGEAGSRTPECARGWTHLLDQRYEARDAQHLLGTLVDQAIARPGALGVAGEGVGGGVALELAFLRNRVRQPDGSFVPWRSPAGLRLSITAAFAVRPAHDLPAALLPNGRFLDFAGATVASRAPLGVARLAAVRSLLDPEGFVAPRGEDPGADLRGWKTVVEDGEPYGAAARRMAGELTRYHSAAGLTGTPAPLLVQARWDDDVFGSSEALRPYNALRARNPRAQVSLQLVHAAQEPAADARRNRFLDAWLRRRGTSPKPGSVLTWAQACPGTPRFSAASWTDLHPGAVRIASSRTRTVTSDGGAPEVADSACQSSPTGPAPPGTTILRRAVGRGFTLLGRPTVTLRLRASGAAGQLDSRLWDVDPAAGRRVLVTRGTYRVTAGQRGEVVLQLEGNGHRFAAGHQVELELAGRDPGTLRPSTGAFSIAISRIAAELPVHERPNRSRGILRPRFAADPALL